MSVNDLSWTTFCGYSTVFCGGKEIQNQKTEIMHKFSIKVSTVKKYPTSETDSIWREICCFCSSRASTQVTIQQGTLGSTNKVCSQNVHNIWLVASTYLKILVKLDDFPNFRGETSKKNCELPPPGKRLTSWSHLAIPWGCGIVAPSVYQGSIWHAIVGDEACCHLFGILEQLSWW